VHPVTDAAYFGWLTAQVMIECLLRDSLTGGCGDATNANTPSNAVAIFFTFGSTSVPKSIVHEASGL
jgi:hypothetical protein